MSDFSIIVLDKSELTVEGFGEEEGLGFGKEFHLLPDTLERQPSSLILDSENEVGATLIVLVETGILIVDTRLYRDHILQAFLKRDVAEQMTETKLFI